MNTADWIPPTIWIPRLHPRPFYDCRIYQDGTQIDRFILPLPGPRHRQHAQAITHAQIRQDLPAPLYYWHGGWYHDFGSSGPRYTAHLHPLWKNHP